MMHMVNYNFLLVHILLVHLFQSELSKFKKILHRVWQLQYPYTWITEYILSNIEPPGPNFNYYL